MMKIAPISATTFAFALALSGCADSSTGTPEPDGDGSGSQEQPQPDPLMDAQGTYRLNSTFDIATNMPGTSGTVINMIIEATDDPADPTSWLVDQIIADMDEGTLKDAIKTVKPLVIDYLNDQLTSLAPDLFNTLTLLGQRLEELTKKFGVNEKLEVSAVDQTYIARSTADGVRFEIAGVTKDYKFVDHNIDNVIVNDILVTLDRAQSKMNIGEHDLPLPWGKIARLGLDAAVIPTIDPTATSLTDLLDNAVNCQAVGASIDDAIGFGGTQFWASACLGGLGLASDMIYDQLVDSDALLGMNLTGTSRYSDLDADFRIDEIKFGNWTGTMEMDAENATLAQPAAYVGKRMMGAL